MNEVRFVTPEHVISFNKQICETYNLNHQLIRNSLLESAVGTTYAFMENEGFLHGSIPELAATLCFKIAKNHAFFDGNKRTAVAAALVFLDLNGYDLVYQIYGDEDTELHRQVLRFVENETNQDDLKKWFIEHSKQR